jgi:cytochrome b involved in lipid metabolism
MSLRQFAEAVSDGEQLVLLDDLVLNVGSYMDNHPGGRFLLSHNIGRDISKFFYGGYAMDGNLVKGQALANTHSKIARL